MFRNQNQITQNAWLSVVQLWISNLFNCKLRINLRDKLSYATGEKQIHVGKEVDNLI